MRRKEAQVVEEKYNCNILGGYTQDGAERWKRNATNPKNTTIELSLGQERKIKTEDHQQKREKDAIVMVKETLSLKRRCTEVAILLLYHVKIND